MAVFFWGGGDFRSKGFCLLSIQGEKRCHLKALAFKNLLFVFDCVPEMIGHVKLQSCRVAYYLLPIVPLEDGLASALLWFYSLLT